MTPVEGLKFALSKEEASKKLYQDLIKEHPDIKDLFQSLLNEEEKHIQLIQRKLSEMTR